MIFRPDLPNSHRSARYRCGFYRVSNYCRDWTLDGTKADLADDVLLLELLLVFFQELLVLLLDHQLLQGLDLTALLLGQRGRLGSSQRTVASRQLRDRRRRQWEASQACGGKKSLISGSFTPSRGEKSH